MQCFYLSLKLGNNFVEKIDLLVNNEKKPTVFQFLRKLNL